MSFSLPLFAVLPALIVCALAQNWQRGSRRRGWLNGLARIGIGLAKIVLLAMPLERLVGGAIHATPQAQSLVSAWMGCLGFSVQLYFFLSGAVDILLGVRRLLGWLCAESFQDPFIAGGFTDFWRDWNASLPRALRRGGSTGNANRDELFFHAVISAGVVLLCVVIWRGVSLATLVWSLVQLILLGLEWWRGGRSLFMPLPLPVRAALTVAVILVSNMLLYLPDLQAALANMRHLFLAPSITVYSVMLDARVTTPWPKYVLWLGMLLSVIARPVRRLLSGSAVARSVIGIPLGLLAWGMLLKDQEIRDAGSPVAWVRHVLQRPLTLDLQEGNAQVFVGRDGWLFRQAELDHLTRPGGVAPLGDALLAFVAQCQSRHKPVLIIAVPDKTALCPQFVLPAEYSAPVQPPGYPAALERLRSAGAVVLDSADRLWSVRKQFPLYFKHDSHWTPEAMKEVALAAAKLIRQKWPQVVINETPLINATVVDRRDAGDLSRDLDPWAPDSLFGEESAKLTSIQGVAPSGDSPVLVLGGDLMEVFHNPALSFGNNEGKPQFAGFVSQLATLMGRSLDAGAIHWGAGPQAFAPWIDSVSRKSLIVCVVRAGDL